MASLESGTAERRARAGDRWRIAIGDDVRLLDRDGRAVALRARKARALIAYLALAPGQRASRVELIALLWSDRGRDQARASLRQCLFDLRGEAPDLIDTDGEQVMLTAPCSEPDSIEHARLTALRDVDPAFTRWIEGRAVAGPAAAPARRAPQRWRWLILPALLGLGLLGWLVLSGHRTAGSAARIISIRAVSPGLPAAAAARFDETLRAAIPSARLTVREADARRAGSDWAITTDVSQDPAALTAQLFARSGALLLSDRYDVRGRDWEGAAAALGRRFGETLLCAMRGPTGPPPDDDNAALLMATCSKINRRDDPAGITVAAQRLIAADPDYAFGHALLAMNLLVNDAPPALVTATRATAEREARRALALDPATGEGWMTLGLLALWRQEPLAAEHYLRRGLAAQPDHPSLNNYLAGMLLSVGRDTEALYLAQASLALDPASWIKLASVAELLSITDQPLAAQALFDQGERSFDRPGQIEKMRLKVLVDAGDVKGAKALLARDRTLPDFLEPGEQAALARRLAAIEHPEAADTRALLAESAAAANGSPFAVANYVQLLVQTGRVAEAVAVARGRRMPPSLFFQPAMRPLLIDAGFPDIARRQGLWAYWTRSGQWPDICRDPARHWRCGAR